MELLKGAYLSDNRDNLVKARTLQDLFIVLAVDETVYEVYGRLAAGLSRGGTPLGNFDEMSAAVTLCYDGRLSPATAILKRYRASRLSPPDLPCIRADDRTCCGTTKVW
ncbi:virulence-associated protein [hydrocarbon metagenome]|uniref:Virulence-associated protein n=1 Tax=hydrocarbon metagenome TaxID=938273 RepID=A0A0W8ESZ7_9ZZZZ